MLTRIMLARFMLARFMLARFMLARSRPGQSILTRTMLIAQNTHTHSKGDRGADGRGSRRAKEPSSEEPMNVGAVERGAERGAVE